MNKKASLILGLILLIMTTIILNTLTHYLWGFNTIYSSDELRNFARARQIASHNIDFYHVWDNPAVYELYPAGIHVLLSSFMLMGSTFNIYLISFIFKIMFAIIPTLLVFLAGLKISKKIGLFSAFFYITSFFIFTNSKSYYVYMFVNTNAVAAQNITSVTLYGALVVFLLSLKSAKKFYIFDIIFLLFLIVHGISHISTYMGFVFNFSLFFISLSIYGFMKRNEKLKNIGIKYFFLTYISLIFVFFIYYFPMYPALLGENYHIVHFFPKFIPPLFIRNLPQILLGGLIILLPVSMILLKKKFDRVVSEPLSSRGKLIFIAGIISLYIIIYLYSLYAVTFNPTEYHYSFTLIFSPFPLYLPFHNLPLISLLSITVGFIAYIFSIFSIYGLLKKWKTNLSFLNIGMMFLLFFIIWWMFGFIYKYYASRIIYFNYILPFILAGGVSMLFKKCSNIGFNGSNIRKAIRLTILLLIISLFLGTSTVTTINKDPVVRDNFNISNPLRFGTISAQEITPSFAIYVNHITEKDEYLLGNYYSIDSLGAITWIKPPVKRYVTYFKNHKLWVITYTALRNPNTLNLQVFCNAYKPTRYMVVGYNEHFRYDTALPVKKYDNSPNLLKIYQSNGGQRVYLIVFNK